MAKLLILIAAFGVAAGSSDDATALLQADVKVVPRTLDEEDAPPGSRQAIHEIEADQALSIMENQIEEAGDREASSDGLPMAVGNLGDSRNLQNQKKSFHGVHVSKQQVARAATLVKDTAVDTYVRTFPTEDQREKQVVEAREELIDNLEEVKAMRKPFKQAAHELVYRLFPSQESRKLNQLSQKQRKYAAKSAKVWTKVEEKERLLQEELFPLGVQGLVSQKEGQKAMTIEQANVEDESFVRDTMAETVEAHKQMYQDYQSKIAEMQQTALDQAQEQTAQIKAQQEADQKKMKESYQNLGDFGAYELSKLSGDKAGELDGLDENQLNFEVAAARGEQTGVERDNDPNAEGSYETSQYMQGSKANLQAAAGSNNYEVAEAMARAKLSRDAQERMATAVKVEEEDNNVDPASLDPDSNNEAEVDAD